MPVGVRFVVHCMGWQVDKQMLGEVGYNMNLGQEELPALLVFEEQLVGVAELKSLQAALMQPKANIQNKYHVPNAMYNNSLPAEPFGLVPNDHLVAT